MVYAPLAVKGFNIVLYKIALDISTRKLITSYYCKTSSKRVILQRLRRITLMQWFTSEGILEMTLRF